MHDHHDHEHADEGIVYFEDDIHLDVLNDVVNTLRWVRDASVRYEWVEQDPPLGLVKDLRDAEASLVSAMVTLTAAVAAPEATDV